MLRIFLSSTFSDLIEERKAVESAIHRMAAGFVGMEHFGSFPDVPLERCVQEVRSAQVVVLVLADRYGHVPEGSPISITESEYQEARRAGIPVLTYLREMQAADEKQVDPRLARLRVELKSGHGVSSFTSPEDLACKVVSDIAREFSSRMRGDLQPTDIKDAVISGAIAGSVEELIGVLEHRASLIKMTFSSCYGNRAVSKYLGTFDQLHQKHIDCLRRGRMVQAHEILNEIHALSASLMRSAEVSDLFGDLFSVRPLVAYETVHGSPKPQPRVLELIRCYAADDWQLRPANARNRETPDLAWAINKYKSMVKKDDKPTSDNHPVH